MSSSAPEMTESAAAVDSKPTPKSLPPPHDLEQNLHTHIIPKLLPQLRRKLLTKGVGLICVGLAMLTLFMYLPTFSFVVFPCWGISSCLVTKPQILTETKKVSIGSKLLKPTIESKLLDPKLVRPDIPTDLGHIVFGIASTVNKWHSRQEYIKLWWQPPPGRARRRGFVWLDEPLPLTANSLTNDSVLPDVRISGNVDSFSYTWKGGSPSAIRISRIVSETFRSGLEDVRWFVMGDDDTIFFPENLAVVLRQYDHNKLYYIGQSTESQKQSVLHSFAMSYGGGGIAISYALAEAMERMQDDCLSRYSHVYGSDSRIEACVAELGVPLTREQGFHQIDVHGNIFGLLAAHPVAPFVSLHHIDDIEPIFPDKDRLQALRHLVDAALPDPEGLLQQSICYDTQRNITVSVSWGFAVQIFAGLITPWELQKPSLTFREWRTSEGDGELFTFDVRALPTDPCQGPSIFFMESVRESEGSNSSIGLYRRKLDLETNTCPGFIGHDVVEVYKQRQRGSWFTAPRRQCCEVVPQKFSWIKTETLTLYVRDLREGEILAPH